MKIWAHRGCSQLYPENTITSFKKAMEVQGLTGIELDVQISKDGELVVIHDEKIDRTTDGFGFVRDYTLKELRSFHIHTGQDYAEHIPTMREVLELLTPSLREYIGGKKQCVENKGLRLNIELKNGVYAYPGLEQKIVDMVKEFDVQDAIVYSSFYTQSLLRVHELAPDAELGILDGRISDCLVKAIGCEQIVGDGFKFALHPAGTRLELDDLFSVEDRTVRAWFGGHLYPEKPSGGKMDVFKFETLGVTDLFLNEPDKYCMNV